MLGTLLLTFFGVFKLWKANGLSRYIGSSAGSIVLVNWVISVGTLGDHRQRLPIMTLSLFLQVVGFASLVGGKRYRIEHEVAVPPLSPNK